MTIDQFMNTKLAGILYSLFILVSLIYLAFLMGKATGYRNGWKKGQEENPNPEVLVVSEYVFDNKRVARFDPRNPDYFLFIDFEEKTIARVPTNKPLETGIMEKENIVATK